MAISFAADTEICLIAEHQALCHGFFIIQINLQGLANFFYSGNLHVPIFESWKSYKVSSESACIELTRQSLSASVTRGFPSAQISLDFDWK
jgi:hypothetical protein